VEEVCYNLLEIKKSQETMNYSIDPITYENLIKPALGGFDIKHKQIARIQSGEYVVIEGVRLKPKSTSNGEIEITGVIVNILDENKLPTDNLRMVSSSELTAI